MYLVGFSIWCILSYVATFSFSMPITLDIIDKKCYNNNATSYKITFGLDLTKGIFYYVMYKAMK